MYLINIDWEIERSNQRTVELRFNKTTGELPDQGPAILGEPRISIRTIAIKPEELKNTTNVAVLKFWKYMARFHT